MNENSKARALFLPFSGGFFSICFVFVGWFCFKRGNADYMKGPHVSDKVS